MAENEKPSAPAAATPGVVPPVPGAPATPPPRRSPGHRGADVKDTVAEMAAKAHEISLEAGSKMAAAMKDVISAAAGLSGFVLESAQDVVQYMVRRGQMTQEEADKLIRAVEEFQPRRKPTPATARAHAGRSAAVPAKKAASKVAVKKAAPKKVAAARPGAKKSKAKKPGTKKPATRKPAAKKPAKKKPAPKKPAAKKSAAKKPAAKKPAAKKPAAKKPAAKKVAAKKKSPARKPAARSGSKAKRR